jgi:hypothetical protein
MSYESKSAKLLQAAMAGVAERNPDAPVFVEIPATPHVGMPATYVIGSDQYGGKLIVVSPTRHRVTFQSESGRITHEFTRRSNGTYYRIGSKHGYLKLGVAKTSFDEGF